MTAVGVRFPDRQSFAVELRCDLDSLALGIRPESMTDEDHRQLRSLAPEEQNEVEAHLRELLIKRVWIRLDGDEAPWTVVFPQKGSAPTAGPSGESPFFGEVALLSGSLPNGVKRFTFQASRAFGVLLLTVEPMGGGAAIERTVGPGIPSEHFSLEPGTAPPFRGRLAVATQYVKLGFEHILPKGLDHILFVLSLFLLSTRLGPLLWQVTAFTMAHSITLALAMFDVVALPGSVVEPLIALSIAVVAVENVLTTRLKPWRPFVVFAFGLLHGLGFAGVLSELGLPRERYATALISFNVGVELGQMAVIFMALAVTAAFRGKKWYRSWVVVPASVAIGVMGLFWTVQRTWG